MRRYPTNPSVLKAFSTLIIVLSTVIQIFAQDINRQQAMGALQNGDVLVRVGSLEQAYHAYTTSITIDPSYAEA
jgi:hypothetical protein